MMIGKGTILIVFAWAMEAVGVTGRHGRGTQFNIYDLGR